jgi:hypothetical protein
MKFPNRTNLHSNLFYVYPNYLKRQVVFKFLVSESYFDDCDRSSLFMAIAKKIRVNNYCYICPIEI